MKIAVATLSSASPYSQSRHVEETRGETELHDAFEARTWRGRMHADQNGVAIIPPMAFKNCLSEAAKFLSVQIKGRGKATYTKHFEAGVMVIEPLSLGVRVEDVPGEWLYVPSDGRRGGDKRVMRCFPIFHSWGGKVAFHILDETIDEDVFRFHLVRAGRFIGIGRFRPRRNGYYGRFGVDSIEWGDAE